MSDALKEPPGTKGSHARPGTRCTATRTVDWEDGAVQLACSSVEASTSHATDTWPGGSA